MTWCVSHPSCSLFCGELGEDQIVIKAPGRKLNEVVLVLECNVIADFAVLRTVIWTHGTEIELSLVLRELPSIVSQTFYGVHTNFKVPEDILAVLHIA